MHSTGNDDFYNMPAGKRIIGVEKLTSLMSKPVRILPGKCKSHATGRKTRQVTIPQWSFAMNEGDGLEDPVSILQATVKNSNRVAAVTVNQQQSIPIAFENQCAVGAAKTERVGHGDVQLHFTGRVRHIIEITLWVDDARAPQVVRKIVEVARTGRMGDGKIFVLPAAPFEAIVDLEAS